LPLVFIDHLVSVEQVKKNVSKRGWQDDLLVTNIGEEVKHNTTLIGHFLKPLLGRSQLLLPYTLEI
jgi:hypothetical protein